MTGDSTPVLPLDDVTVVEVDSWMAAPSAAAMLADLGATVIKVEPLRGDPMRNASRSVRLGDDADPARSSYDYQFDVANRGKRSIAADLGSEAGRDVLHRLVGSAEVFVCNLLVHRQERFGLDPATLLGVNPRLVHATLSGYGTVGPDSQRPGYDVTAFFGRSGLYDAMREGEDGVVPMARPAQGDYTTGLAFLGTILSALRLAERSGRGQVVETSLYETAVWTQASDYAITAIDRRPLRPRSREHQVVATMNRFRGGDGRWLVVNEPKDAAWPMLCRALGREDLIDDERFATVRDRFRNMPELMTILDEVFATRSRDQWGEVLDAAGLVWGPVLGLHEVVADPQAEAVGLFPELDHPDIGVYPTVASPLRFRTAEVGPRAPSPALGADSREVLVGAGFEPAEIDELVAAGVIRQSEEAEGHAASGRASGPGKG